MCGSFFVVVLFFSLGTTEKPHNLLWIPQSCPLSIRWGWMTESPAPTLHRLSQDLPHGGPTQRGDSGWSRDTSLGDQHELSKRLSIHISIERCVEIWKRKYTARAAHFMKRMPTGASRWEFAGLIVRRCALHT